MANDNNKPKRVDIGGQAVMEGVMMRSPDATAIAVRRPDGSIVVTRKDYVPLSKKHKWMGYPFLRGMVNMATMLTGGMSTLEESTKMLGVLDEEPTKFEKWLSEKLGKGIDKIVMAVAIVLAVVLSIGLFMAIPAGVESLLKGAGMSAFGYTLLGGIVKIAILIAYMAFCGAVPDVKRTFQYHGAEHKTVYCHEHDLPLTPENAQQFTTLHPRCGTAFLLIVFCISILLFLCLNILVPISNYFLRLGFHLLMLPIVAGVSYEVLKGLAHSESKVCHALRWPGLQMQRLTTRQPDAGMLECAIVAMNVALHGMPEGYPVNADGYTVMKTYQDSRPEDYPDYVREEEPAVPAEDLSEDDNEANG